MMTVPHGVVRWRKSTRSSGEDTCVEVTYDGAVRDSKNPGGPMLDVDLAGLLASVKAGRLG